MKLLLFKISYYNLIYHDTELFGAALNFEPELSALFDSPYSWP